MTNRIVNGTFTQTVVTGTAPNQDIDPAGWTVSEPSSINSVTVFNGTLNFNRDDSPTDGSVSQTVTNILGDREVTFSFDYRNVGAAAALGRSALVYRIIRIAPDGAETVQVGPVTVSTNGTHTTTFTPPVGGPYSYRIELIDASTNTIASDVRIDNVVFDAPTCFTPGTLIEAEDGPVPVEAIEVGDMIVTKDSGLQPVRWIGRRKLSAADLDARPDFRPIRIRAGALGDGLPRTDLTVSPQHRLLVRGGLVCSMFGSHEVLVSARHLLAMPGIEIDDAAEVEYLHILFDQHELVIANGALTETLYLGQQTLSSLTPEGRDEVLALFPELQEMDVRHWPASRPILKGREGRAFAEEKAAADTAGHVRQLGVAPRVLM